MMGEKMFQLIDAVNYINAVVPNHCSGDNKFSLSSFEVLPLKNLKSTTFHAEKLSLTLDMRGLLTILLSGAPQPLEGWETLH